MAECAVLHSIAVETTDKLTRTPSGLSLLVPSVLSINLQAPVPSSLPD